MKDNDERPDNDELKPKKDAISAENVGTNVSSDSVKCKSCGSNMIFDPDTQKLKCTYCGYTEDFLKSVEVEELDIENALKKNEKWSSETLVFQCDNCGAQIVAEKGQTAVLCPFCGTSHVTAVEDLEGIRPNAVLPFTISKEQVAENFRNWSKKKLFAPGEFKRTTRVDKIKGVYMPFFTFDSQTESVYEGRVGDTYTRTVQTKDGTRTETYTVWRHVSGTLSHFFDDVLINAGREGEGVNLNKLAPFDWSGIKVFENKFLTGYFARRYEKDLQTCWGNAKDVMDKELRDMIIARCHCDVVDYVNVHTRHSNVKYKYVMLPVYVINYNYKKKHYTIYANGTTGKIIGKSPVSPAKASIAGVIGAIVVAGVILLIYYFMRS